MHVHSRLPRRRADIDPDIESVGRMLGASESVSATKKLENRHLLLDRHFEEVRHVALGHNENVATTQ
jgi:hypothetical protein